MTRFTGVAFAIALACGCAGSKKDEARSGSPGPSNTATADQGGSAAANMPLDQAPGGGGVTETHETRPTGTDSKPTDTGAKTGESVGGAKPLDPSANADPNSPKQQARTTGLLGASNDFDDSAVDLQLSTPDDPIKTWLEKQKSELTACHKSGGGTLEIELTVDATGKVTKVKIVASSTLKDAKARNCVIAIVKKLKLDKGTKPTGSIKLAFPK